MDKQIKAVTWVSLGKLREIRLSLFDDMRLLYQIVIFFFQLSAYISSFFSSKSKKFVSGRKNLFSKLEVDFLDNKKQVAWFHCASLGEFEQGRPIIELFRKQYPDFVILLTFFSPSGYELRKDYPLADYVYYIPIDTAKNAKKFIHIVKPKVVYFIKYEFWYHFIREIYNNNIPIISVSSIFRKNQIFFNRLGHFYVKALRSFSHFFVQNQHSKLLLQDLGISQVEVAGDTRFDRVKALSDSVKSYDIIESFKKADSLFVIGSSWEKDIDVLAPIINNKDFDFKFLIAPHELDKNHIEYIENSLNDKVLRYSQIDETTRLADYRVMIIDTIGMLSSLYQYADYVFIGGAYGKGLHNILEAAVYGPPVFFGNLSYHKFQEAIDLINLGAAFAVADSRELEGIISNFESDHLNKKGVKDINIDYVNEHVGASEKVMKYTSKILQSAG